MLQEPAWFALLCVHFKKKKHYQREDIVDISKMPRVSLKERHEAVGMLRLMTAAAVARHFGVSQSTMSSLQGRPVMTGSVADGRRYGRPRLRTAAKDHRISDTHLRECFKSVISKALEWDSDEVSKHIVDRLLRQEGFKCRRPCKNFYF